MKQQFLKAQEEHSEIPPSASYYPTWRYWPEEQARGIPDMTRVLCSLEEEHQAWAQVHVNHDKELACNMNFSKSLSVYLNLPIHIRGLNVTFMYIF